MPRRVAGLLRRMHARYPQFHNCSSQTATRFRWMVRRRMHSARALVRRNVRDAFAARRSMPSSLSIRETRLLIWRNPDRLPGEHSAKLTACRISGQADNHRFPTAPHPIVNAPQSLPTVASVVFIRIAGYTKRPVGEQARLRSQLESALAVAFQGIPARCRIPLDAPDGMAIAVLEHPEAALNIAERCAGVGEIGIALSIGINHGAIQLMPDDANHPGLLGDTIGIAASIAEFGGPQRITASRTFADALAQANPLRARSLKRTGAYTDAQVRTHELFTPDPGVNARRRKILFMTGGALTVALLVGAITLRSQRRETAVGSRSAGFGERLRDLLRDRTR